MPTFLSLPLEIRHLIYNLVLHSEGSPPTTKEELSTLPLTTTIGSFITGGNRTKRPPPFSRGKGNTRHIYNERHNWYLATPPPLTSTPLLQTIIQVHTEVWDTIARLKRSKSLRYKIDCLIREEWELYPTWTCIPALSKHINIVDADIRLVGGRRKDGSNLGGRFTGDRASLIWGFYALLTRFLVRGPVWMAGKGEAVRMSVGTVRVSVVSPIEPKEGYIPSGRSWEGVGLEGRVVDPAWVEYMIWWKLGVLLGGEKDAERFAGILFERVGRIELLRDEVLKRIWNLEQISKHEKEKTSIPCNGNKKYGS